MREFSTLKTEELSRIARLLGENCTIVDIVDMYRVPYADVARYRRQLGRLETDMAVSRPMKDALKFAAERRQLSPEQLAEQLVITVFEDCMVSAVLNDPPDRRSGVRKVPSYLQVIAGSEAHNRGMTPKLLVSQILERIIMDDMVDRVLDDAGETT